ncbi:lytic transglycosylase domain-containing protein [Cognatishimia sp. F0-27]|uniref:lytic transglycosylase domain-containing protein n=1 Tax=Cognatishimia sp. F0-27 TaxID=2816855 RepID=UPI001D0C3148|nr:lytic transglycosylase domain-containing protein [Cognatishimia sp. F0-27]MCC1492197.1 lytic transglycosylase domain-containing protein [Cognatishimia sp. F0-27]
MSRFLSVLALILAPLAPAAAQQQATPAAARTEIAASAAEAVGQAMDSLRAGNWAQARSQARTAGPVALDIVLWHELRAGRGDTAEVLDFVARNPDWPGMPYLRQQSEEAVAEASNAAIRTFFEAQPPRTGEGALALARAFMADGEEGAAIAEAVIAWRTLSLDQETRSGFLRDFTGFLDEHHTARLDMALWNGWELNARAMLPLVDDGWKALAEARLGLRDQVGGVDTLIEAVPDALSDHPGLAYERFLWRYRKGRLNDAITLLLERSTSAQALGEPERWARARRDLARDVMRDGDVALAYRIASSHYLTAGSNYADLEWLSGYIALRFLNDPALAVEHFTRFRAAVWSPISVGRGGYWLGRAQAALGNLDAAQAAFEDGAQYQTSFYGLLAAEAGRIPPSPTLAGTETFPDWRTADFTDTTVFNAALLLLAANEISLAERFLTHLAESLDRTGIGQIGAMLEEMNQPHLQVMLGKRAATMGIEIPGPYYALHPVIVANDYPVDKALVHAIARRESEFDPVVQSGVGARGFMQLMPGTARDVSGWLDLDYSREKLITDPSYNAVLGSEYLAYLARRFDANVVMMAAGYNAGPGRPPQWIARFGDPVNGSVDMIDWIEFIPFDETRNYVMRVAESLPVYRARLGRDPLPIPFSEELRGATLPAAPGSGNGG